LNAQPVDAEFIRQRVTEKAGEYFPGVDREKLETECRPFSERSTYPLYLCRLNRAGGTGPVAGAVVKFAPVHPDNNEGLTEFEHLKLLHDKLGDDGALRVPRPLDFYGDVNALVTEEVKGERFSRILLRDTGYFTSGDRRQTLHLTIDRCGQWLARFHELTGCGKANAFDTPFREGLNHRIRILKRFGFPVGTEKRISDTVSALEEYGSRVHAPFADLHGDFGPQNVHVGDNWICVFDLSYARQAPVFDDITYFLVTLETVNPFPRQPFFKRRSAMALRAPFLQGYFGVGPIDRKTSIFLEGYYLKALLYRCVKQRRNVGRRPLPVRIAFDKFKIGRYYPRRIQQQCDRILELLAG
jgi:Ser/Thr protein kinase RdoA (MazF antagonist)